MRKIRYILFFAIASTVGNVLYAQQDGQITLYMFNDLYFNPAFAGVEGVTKISALHRSQWLGYQATFDDGTAPTTQVLSMTSPIYRLLPGTSGFGVNIVNDKLGIQNNLQIQGAFAYHIGIKKSKLSVGVRFGIYSQSFDTDKLRPNEENDVVIDAIRNSGESQVRPDMAFGLYYRAEKVYAGISVNHLLKAEFDFGTDSVRNPLEQHYYLTGGYIHQVNFDLKLKPSLMIQTDLNTFNFTIGGVVVYKEKINAGLAFRQSEDANLIIGYNFLKDKSLSVNYSFGYIIKDQDAKQPTSHDFMLSYTLPVSPGGGKKIVRTPRFRH